MKAYLSSDLAELPIRVAELRMRQLDLRETATGYGERLSTAYMVHYRNKWRRVYCRCFSNVETLYIGKRADNLTVRLDS